LEIPDIKNPETVADRKNGIISSCITVSSGTTIWDSMDDKSMLKNDGKIFIRNTDCATLSDFQAFIDGVELAYELATPIVMQFDPISLRSNGVTNISVDCGEVTELKYFSDTP
jgi:hypothetical protein